MNMTRKIIAAAFAVMMGLSIALPARALADEHDHDHDRAYHQFWRDHDRDDHHDRDDRGDWRWDHDRDRDHFYGRRYLPPNGEGMVSHRNPNYFWTCDSDGHHCHWQHR